MSVNSLFAASAIAMLVSGSAYIERRAYKGVPSHTTDPKKKRKRKDQRAARRKNRK